MCFVSDAPATAGLLMAISSAEAGVQKNKAAEAMVSKWSRFIGVGYIIIRQRNKTILRLFGLLFDQAVSRGHLRPYLTIRSFHPGIASDDPMIRIAFH
jgi:hypothetical protein